MTGEALTPYVIAGFAALGALGAMALVGLGLWVNRALREYHRTKRAQGVAVTEWMAALRAGEPKALERAQREIGH